MLLEYVKCKDQPPASVVTALILKNVVGAASPPVQLVRGSIPEAIGQVLIDFVLSYTASYLQSLTSPRAQRVTVSKRAGYLPFRNRRKSHKI